ncbi:MAG: FliM/FliN family flagellar motor switch protein [Pseudomonadota bacterium]
MMDDDTEQRGDDTDLPEEADEASQDEVSQQSAVSAEPDSPESTSEDTEALITSEERDTLMAGLSDGSINTEGDIGSGEVELFDFEGQHNAQIKRMHRLEGVHENFVRNLAMSLEKKYSREPVVEMVYVHACRFGEYMDKVETPSALNLIYVIPSQRPALLVLRSTLLFLLVDHYYGGQGSLKGRDESTGFSPTERRMAQQVTEMVSRDLQKAWSNVSSLSFESGDTEENPDNMRIYKSNEIVVELGMRVGFDDNVSELQVVLPFAVLEDARSILEADSNTDQDPETDSAWQMALSEQVGAAGMTIRGVLSGGRLKVSELMSLKAGQVLPIPVPNEVTVTVEGMPTYMGRVFQQHEHYAVQLRASYTDQTQGVK